MSNGTPRLTRSDRVAALELPPGQFERVLNSLRRSDVWIRIGLCLLAALVLAATTRSWAPPFAYRAGCLPARDIVARVEFSVANPAKTEDQKKRVRSQTICYYANDEKPLDDVLKALRADAAHLVGAASYADADPKVWRRFHPSTESANRSNPIPSANEAADEQKAFDAFRAALAADKDLVEFGKALERALVDIRKTGTLSQLQHSPEDGNDRSVWVHPVGNEAAKQLVQIELTRIVSAHDKLRQRLTEELRVAQMLPDNVEQVVTLTMDWVARRGLPQTLALNEQATSRDQLAALNSVTEVTDDYRPGDRIAEGQKPLAARELQLLREEYREVVHQQSWWRWLGHAASTVGMYFALYILCGVYVFFHQPRLLLDLQRLGSMLALVVVVVVLCWSAAADSWRAEIVPLMLFGMTVALAYDRDLALLLSAVVALAVVLSLGQGLAEFVLLVATVSSAILMLGRVRSRTKIIYVGLGAGLVALLTTVGVGTLVAQSFGPSNLVLMAAGADLPSFGMAFPLSLLIGAAWNGFCALLAAFLMTGLLPFVERLFEVQTDLSLLELGDAAHPLLQELAQRAPGTYNHSINVASIGEKAAEAIGANGLLVRVGAYFHDIGKMLKPGYFVENQGQQGNRHESLLPAMSTLVIIAHVKDGSDLARQHHLPRPIIDFIEQHHGTTLVEYFYRQATKQQEVDPDGSEVDETYFRYPGPKPQTREAAVMMLADAVESASRTLVDPSPARIESLVREMGMKRLLDGQFDDCNLTLQDLKAIEASLVSSLTSVYHGRVKYPDHSEIA